MQQCLTAQIEYLQLLIQLLHKLYKSLFSQFREQCKDARQANHSFHNLLLKIVYTWNVERWLSQPDFQQARPLLLGIFSETLSKTICAPHLPSHPQSSCIVLPFTQALMTCRIPRVAVCNTTTLGSRVARVVSEFIGWNA